MSGDESIFKALVDASEQDELFKVVASGDRSAPARRLMNERAKAFIGKDKSFVRELQTQGFSARVFELAIFSYLEEQGIVLDPAPDAPDFVFADTSGPTIEVTTSNAPEGRDRDLSKREPLIPSDLSESERLFVFQIGKALRRKLVKRDAAGRGYWELPSASGRPFVIAVSAFHDSSSQLHPVGLVSDYLYGRRMTPVRGGYLSEAIEDHKLGDRSIPSGLFRQPEAKYLSGVLFSNSHTFSKFNRMGLERSPSDFNVGMLRVGTAFDSSSGALTPAVFSYVVGDRPPEVSESFAEGLHLFINPWARHSVEPEWFPNIAVGSMDGRRVISTVPAPGLNPFASKTLIYLGEGAKDKAREANRRFREGESPESDGANPGKSPSAEDVDN